MGRSSGWQPAIAADGGALDGTRHGVLVSTEVGGITAVAPPPDAAEHPSSKLWNGTDDPDREFAEGPHIGAKTVSRWREDFLRDFAERMLRCQAPVPSN